MLSATPPAQRSPRTGRPRTEGSRGPWWRWLVLGLCFSLGYGLTQRLGRMGSSSAATGAVPSFAAQETPGTRLAELQKRFGAEGHSLLGDLDRLVEERRQEGQRQEEESRKATQEQLNQQRQEDAQRQADRIRLEALNRGPDPAASNPEPILLPPQTPAQPQTPDPYSDPVPADTTSPGAAANPP
jgi:TolA-binding protein